MSVIDINDAFHTLIDTGTLADNAYQKITDALTHGDLGLWCGSRKIELHEIRSRLRFTIRDDNLLVGSTEALGWPPGMYVFTIDSEQFERLLVRAPVGRPGKLTVEMLADEEAERCRTGRPISRKSLAGHFGVSQSTIDRVRKKMSSK